MAWSYLVEWWKRFRRRHDRVEPKEGVLILRDVRRCVICKEQLRPLPPTERINPGADVCTKLECQRQRVHAMIRERGPEQFALDKIAVPAGWNEEQTQKTSELQLNGGSGPA